MIDFEKLKERYDFSCAKCGHEMSFDPSIMMEMGENHGGGRCSKCKTHLKLKISDCGEKGESELYEDFIKKAEEEKNG